jgi:uncharacterized OB-fold protein
MFFPILIIDERFRMKNRVPFKEGLFEEVSGKWVLVGCKCKQCGKVVYPVRKVCLNCLGRDLERLNLTRNGKLYSFSIVHMPSEHFQPPYAIGWIELPEGIRVFSQIRGWEEHPLKTGIDMELSIEKLWDEEEKEVIGYTFRPFMDKGGT